MVCSQSIRNMVLATLKDSGQPDTFNNPVKMATFCQEVREYVRDMKAFMGQLNSAYRLILG